ncbi:3-deoxy-manno-octulosonate cytidylyltransferase [Amphiplicatus metriothermophilus]|uniref:3-deoxy-manno-octulosonate cytidylyltransferase n=1 Tax=Amphiplicatus metriothermophilus TaxID=1519374 RepID=A0A239PVD2_9PROT|nr:3-deoxy-manno-octulosonate cytidylyltransferase [Amphiplicatus metriothermophilus]MBB5519688.1 3-deoxy-manno-octulosonate cytidylyltransferase (CMP-KDO synthetase) [Amphiplicatus metriothermophilus]SNT74251.1 3-deoxy-manno-octulosonate cytidylyltransferase (CMP-KDO synthetase) [Amphiplicatus metriothermophilus]
MKAVIVIPARYASTRLPGKLLLEAGGKPLIQHTYERACQVRAADGVIVATDDARIFEAVRAFGGEAAMTDPAHTSGSARVAQAARGLDADVVVNLQGDEPEIDPAHIDRLIALQAARAPFASTLVCPFPPDARPDDPAAVKAILGKRAAEGAYEALYFTRALAPFPRDRQDAPNPADYHLHIGVYAFRADALQCFAAAPEGRLERIEKLEQLRILEMGEKILAAEIPAAPPGVDTAADFDAFRKRVEKA